MYLSWRIRKVIARPNIRLLNSDPIHIKGIDKASEEEVKLLGVCIDSGLRYKIKLGTKGLKAVIALR